MAVNLHVVPTCQRPRVLVLHVIIANDLELDLE